MNKFVTILAFFSMICAAYAMEKNEGKDGFDPVTVAGRGSKPKEIVVTSEEVSGKLSTLKRKQIGGSIFHNMGIGAAPKDYVELSAATVIITQFMTEKLSEVGRELANTQSNLSQTATDMRGSADIFSRSAATEKALKEEQERTSQLMQELTRLKFQQQALELEIETEKGKTHDLLTAKNNAEQDALLKQKRAETLEELNKEQARIIEQLQHVQQEKENLLENKRRLENLLKAKLKLEGSGELNPEELEKIIEEKEEHTTKALKELRDLVEEERRRKKKKEEKSLNYNKR